MADVKFGHVAIDAKGKTKEEIKDEVMKQVNIQLDEMFNNKDKEESRPFAKLHIKCDESEDRKGFSLENDSEGTGQQLYQMLICVVIDVLAGITSENCDEIDPNLVMSFVHDLLKEVNKKNDMEEEDA